MVAVSKNMVFNNSSSGCKSNPTEPISYLHETITNNKQAVKIIPPPIFFKTTILIIALIDYINLNNHLHIVLLCVQTKVCR